MEVYDPESVDWDSFFANQSAGNKNYDNFVARRGTGLGNILKALRRFAVPLLKKAGKAALQRGARMAKEEAISAGKAMLNDLSQEQHAPVSHIVRDRAREGALKFGQRVRRGRGLGSTIKKKTKEASLGIVKSEKPKRGRLNQPALRRR